jgi:hypothetical protein
MTFFPGGHRAYRLFTPPHEARRLAEGMAMTIVDGESLHCSYRVRLDHHKTAIAKGDDHLCKFTSMKRPIVDLIRRTHENEAGISNIVAHLVACHNLLV